MTAKGRPSADILLLVCLIGLATGMLIASSLWQTNRPAAMITLFDAHCMAELRGQETAGTAALVAVRITARETLLVDHVSSIALIKDDDFCRVSDMLDHLDAVEQVALDADVVAYLTTNFTVAPIAVGDTAPMDRLSAWTIGPEDRTDAPAVALSRFAATGEDAQTTLSLRMSKHPEP